MTHETVEEPARRFLVPVKKGWKLWIPPVIALLYFGAVLAVVLNDVTLGIPDEEMLLVLGGMGLFALLLLWELLLLPTVKARRRAHAEAAEVPAEEFPAEEEAPAAEPDHAAYRPTAGGIRQGGDVELTLTNGEHQGRRIIELSTPPKSAHQGAIYSKALVAIDDRYVLRVEDLVASHEDF